MFKNGFFIQLREYNYSLNYFEIPHRLDFAPVGAMASPLIA